LNLHKNQCFLDTGCGTDWVVRYTASLVNNEAIMSSAAGEAISNVILFE